MGHRNKHLGSDQMFNSHSNLAVLLPLTTYNKKPLLSYTTLNHPWQEEAEQACGQSHHQLDTVLPNIQAMTLLWLPPSPQWALITVTLYHLMKQESRTLCSVDSLSSKHTIYAFSYAWVHTPDIQFPSSMFCPDSEWQDLLLAEEG